MTAEDERMPLPTPIRPNRAQSRRKPSMAERLEHAERRAEELQKTNDVLVDLLNAVVLRDGGRIVIAAEYVRAATRQALILSWSPGMTHLVLHPEGSPALPPPPTLRERLHLPGGSRG